MQLAAVLRIRVGGYIRGGEITGRVRTWMHNLGHAAQQAVAADRARKRALRLNGGVRRLGKTMLDVLAKIYDEGGAFLGAQYTLFDGDQRFITAVGLRFETICAVFRAVPDDDTLAVTVDRLEPDADETLIDASNFAPWATCVGLGICWAWRLTNQQGYSDGVRLEFSKPGESSRAVIELMVAASAIEVLRVVAGAAAEQAVPADRADGPRSG